MPVQMFAAKLETATSTASNPFHFLAIVFSYMTSLASPLIDTPEERQAVEDAILAVYDKITLGLMATSPVMAGVFVAFRKYVKDAIDRILLALTPAPSPTPAPLPISVPQGSAP